MKQPIESLPEKSLIWPGVVKQVIDVIEVSEVGVNLYHPVRLYQDDGRDIDDADFLA